MYTCKVFLALALNLFALTVGAATKSHLILPIQYREVDPLVPSVHQRGLTQRESTTLSLRGSIYEYGYFYTHASFGTPPQSFNLIVDTGSSLTYVPCSTCRDGCGRYHANAPFDPAASSTVATVSCVSPFCQCGGDICGCASTTCAYELGYAEGSSTSGVILRDVLSLQQGGLVANVTFGCAEEETGLIYRQRADGIFALSNSSSSAITQLVAAGVVEDIFSLCFGGLVGDGALLLGDAPLPPEVQLQYTPLQQNPPNPSYYVVMLEEVVVGGEPLPLESSVFEEGYGSVLDSGTTFTYLPSVAFQAFVARVEETALGRGLFRVPGPNSQVPDVCFGGVTDHSSLPTVFPSMALHFKGMAPLQLPPENYLFVHSFGTGMYCLGVFDNGNAGSLLGGITFRNILVQYDRANGQVGFGPTNCRELGKTQAGSP